MRSRKGHSRWVVVVTSKEFRYEEVLSFQTHEQAMKWIHGEELEDIKALMEDVYTLAMSEKLYLQKWNSQQEIWWRRIKQEYGF
jgi:hypothetical protein